MKSAFTDAGAFHTAPLDQSQWQDFRSFYLSLSKPDYFAYLIEQQDEPQAWIDAMVEQNGDWKMFGLWDAEKLIGITAISFRKVHGRETANFTASEIADSYRGRGLSKHLYDARLNYLKSIAFNGVIETYISPDNEISSRAALSQGFEKSNDPLWEGHQRFVFKPA